MKERIVVVHNPVSTRNADVEKRVFSSLDREETVYTRFTTPSALPEDNIAAMQEVFRDGDLIISAAGDGTANQVSNAIIREGLDNATVGFLGYGNFNDSAFTTDPIRLLNAREQTIVKWPMRIEINDQYYRHAVNNASLGWSALVAHELNTPRTREIMRRVPSPLKTVASLGHVAAEYFLRRDTRLPAYRPTRSQHIRHETTDVVFMNAASFAGILRHAAPFRNDFAVSELDISGHTANVPFMVRSLLGRMPAVYAENFAIEFAQPSDVPIQVDGDGETVGGVRYLRVQKVDKDTKLRIIHP